MSIEDFRHHRDYHSARDAVKGRGGIHPARHNEGCHALLVWADDDARQACNCGAVQRVEDERRMREAEREHELRLLARKWPAPDEAPYPPQLLRSEAGCEAALREVGSHMARATNRSRQLLALPRISPAEVAEFEYLEARMAFLKECKSAIKRARGWVQASDRGAYNEAFVNAAKQRLPREMYEALHSLAMHRLGTPLKRTKLTGQAVTTVGGHHSRSMK